MMNEFVVQVLAGMTVAVLGGFFVMLRQRAKGFPRPSPVVALSVVLSLVAAGLVVAYLVGFLVVVPPGGGRSSNAAMPVVTRIEGSGIDRRRGFFTPQGFLVAPAHDLPVGMAVAASWAANGGANTASGSISRLGACRQSVALLEIGEAPQSAFLIGESSGLQPGDTVTRFVPNEPISGTVVEVGATHEAGPGCTWLITTQLNNSHLVHSGDTGAPVLDASGRVVAMIAMNDIEQRYTLSIPIEQIREEFPWAFEAQARSPSP